MIYDTLGTRMKQQYEERTQTKLPRRTYTIIRLDGRCFHTWTKNLKRPFDAEFIEAFDKAVSRIMPDIMGARFAYTQSDEVSILMTDFEDVKSDAWFDGNVQKIVSISSSLLTAAFNDYYSLTPVSLANFDSRVFTIPDPVEVENYFIWRQKDAMRNSLNLMCSHYYTHRELNGKSQQERIVMLRDKGVEFSAGYKRFRLGGFIAKMGRSWMSGAAPVFTDHRPLGEWIPKIWAEDKA